MSEMTIDQVFDAYSQVLLNGFVPDHIFMDEHTYNEVAEGLGILNEGTPISLEPVHLSGMFTIKPLCKPGSEKHQYRSVEEPKTGMVMAVSPEEAEVGLKSMLGRAMHYPYSPILRSRSAKFLRRSHIPMERVCSCPSI